MRWKSSRLVFTLAVICIGIALSAANNSVGADVLMVAPPPAKPNPLINPRSCQTGLNIAIAADISGSFTPKYLKQEQAALKIFVNTLLPNPRVHISLSTFSSGDHTKDTKTLQAFTNDATKLDNSIDKFKSGGGTNWEAGMKQAASTYMPNVFPGLSGGGKSKGYTPSRDEANILLIATDGGPTAPLGFGSTQYSQIDLGVHNAVMVTNRLKTGKGQPTPSLGGVKVPPLHILALGIHATEDDPHIPFFTAARKMQYLEDISGPNVNTGGFNADVITTDYGTMAQQLKSLATDSCHLGSGGGGGTGGGHDGPGPGTGGSGGTGGGQSGGGHGSGGGGTGGTGGGSGGTGHGGGGSGSGSGGAGGSGGSGGQSPAPSPNPAPSNPTHNPNPSPRPSDKQQQKAPAPISNPTNQTKDPASKPKGQGTKKRPPEKLPSPFMDGKLFAHGVINDDFTYQPPKTPPIWIIVAVGAVALALAAAGGIYWQRKKSTAKTQERLKQKI